MAVTDDMVATIRAYLSGDREQFQRRNRELGQAHAVRRAFQALLTAAYVEAVERRFAAGAARDEIVGFVADLRSRGDRIAENLDPDAAERMIAAVFDDDVDTRDIDANQSIGVKMGALALIISEERLDSAELEEFLDKARAFANELLG